MTSVTADAASASLLRQAFALIEQGPSQRTATIACLRQVLARHPDHAPSSYNLGYLLRQAGQFQDALQAYAQEVHLNRAALHFDHLRQYAQAKAELDAALALAPTTCRPC